MNGNVLFFLLRPVDMENTSGFSLKRYNVLRNNCSTTHKDKLAHKDPIVVSVNRWFHRQAKLYSICEI